MEIFLAVTLAILTKLLLKQANSANLFSVCGHEFVTLGLELFHVFVHFFSSFGTFLLMSLPIFPLRYLYTPVVYTLSA